VGRHAPAGVDRNRRCGGWRPGRLGAAALTGPQPPQGAPAAVVVGGGLAGAAAALTLGDRGIPVTLLEAAPRLGGRLSAVPHGLPDGTITGLDHGFHAFFRHYYNLRRMLARIDPAGRLLRPVPDYPVTSRRWGTESFGRLPRRPPANLAVLLLRSPSLRLADLRRLDREAASMMLRYDPDTAGALDGMTAAQYLDRLRLPDRARAMLFEGFARSFFVPEEMLSAAELVEMFHFYFLGNPEGLAFDAPGEDHESALWAPLAAELRRVGVTVRCGAPARDVDPVEGGGWQVRTTTGWETRAGLLVLAPDLPGLQALVGRSAGLAGRVPGTAAAVRAAAVAPPYAVARFWLDRDCLAGRPVFTGVAREPALDLITCYHRLEAGARRWANRAGGAVLELHSYAVPAGIDEEDLARALLADLAGLWPETAAARVLHRSVHVRGTAPAFPPGSAGRPGVATEDPTVVLAGDWLRLPQPSALMERAVTSGILAASRLLVGLGRPPVAVRGVRPRGLLARQRGPEQTSGR
jgi:isorenieratene synthase